MLKKKFVWICMMILVLMAYLGLVVSALAAERGSIFIAVLLVLLTIHLLEMKTALRIGRTAGCSDRRIIIMNLLFGFLWWLPVKWGVWTCGKADTGSVDHP